MNTKMDTFVLLTKLSCYVFIGAGTPMISSLAQWANSGEWPEKIQWVVIITGACVGGATQVLSFLSSSYAKYNKTAGETPTVANTKP